MDNTMLIGLTRQLTLRRQMDVVANNIANANTQGFKAERMMLEPDTSMRARHQDGPNRARFVDEWAMGRDFSQGSLTQTSRPLDVALEGGADLLPKKPGGLAEAERLYRRALDVDAKHVNELIIFIAGVVGFMLVGVLQAMFKITTTIGRKRDK